MLIISPPTTGGRGIMFSGCPFGSWSHVNTRDGPNVRLWHSAEAEGLGRLTERVLNVRPIVVC